LSLTISFESMKLRLAPQKRPFVPTLIIHSPTAGLRRRSGRSVVWTRRRKRSEKQSPSPRAHSTCTYASVLRIYEPRTTSTCWKVCAKRGGKADHLPCTPRPAANVREWDGPAVLRPCQRAKLARDTKTKEHAMSQILNSKIDVIGIDIGKNSFHVVGQDRRGALVLRQKWSRGQVEARLANLPGCLIGMEACTGAHHLSRKLQALGHDARLMPAKYVRPYSKGQKNDLR